MSAPVSRSTRCAGEAGASDNRAGDDFWPLLFVLVAYIILTFALDPIPDSELYGEKGPSNGDLLAAVDAELASGEQRLRDMERYITSDTFTLRSRFRQL